VSAMEKFDWMQTIKTNIFFLKVVGLWPNKTYKLNLYTGYAIISILTFQVAHTAAQAINLLFIFDNFEAVMQTILVLLTQILSIFKTYNFSRNMRILKQLIAAASEHSFQPKTDTQISMIVAAFKLWKTMYRTMWIFCAGALFFWSIFPMIDTAAGQHRLPFLAWYPYNFKTSPLYEITYVYQVVSNCVIASSTLNVDTLIAALNIFTGAQFDILCDDMRNLVLKERTTMKKLKSLINHHQEILR
jgi:hypothetical protein